MEFLDREDELGRLEHVTAKAEGALIVLWGRRRIGKTRLLLEWVRRTKGLYWVADGSSSALQRRNFAETLEARLPGFGQVDYRDWGTLLSQLARAAEREGWHGPLVLDEVPYLLGPAPELPAVLQRFIDHDARKANLVVAIAGSSQRMMQGLTLSHEAPLYGRARELMKLRPIPPGYIGEALGLREAHKCVQAYALWGGVPRYWELAAQYPDLREGVDEIALNPLGPLHEEPTRLLLEENPPAIALRPVLDAIGAGAHRVSEIGGRIGQSATSLSRPLARLQELDLVTREIPFGEPERSSKRALYKLSDPFLRLWFSLIGPRRSILLQVKKPVRLRLFDTVFPRLTSNAWEDLCRQAVPHLSERLGGIDFGPASRYWAGSGPEWDVVSESLDGSALLLGEVKWIDGEPSTTAVEHAARELFLKGALPVRRLDGASVHHVIFVSRKPRGKLRLAMPNVHVLDANDVLGVLR